MMALPFRWYDQFVDRGHPRSLTRGGLALTFAIGRHVDGRTLRTHIGAARLREEAGLSRASYFRARRELLDRGIIRIRNESGRSLFVLVSPLPDTPKSLSVETRRSQRRDSSVSQLRHPNRRNIRRAPTPADGQQQTKNSAKKQISSALARSLAEHFGDVPSDVALEDVLEKVASVAGALSQSPSRFDEEAFTLSRDLQASGWFVGEVQVREVLKDALAVSDPFVQAAMSMFNGEILGVRHLEEAGEGAGSSNAISRGGE